MGFGTEILLMLTLGFVVLGPKQMHAMLGHVARAKADLENAMRGMKSQFAAEVDSIHKEGTAEASKSPGGSEV